MEEKIKESGKKFWYVYDRKLAKYLRYQKGIEYNCTGLNIKTKNQFWQFNKTEELIAGINEYETIKKIDSDIK
jgi:hypothetical protein